MWKPGIRPGPPSRKNFRLKVVSRYLWSAEWWLSKFVSEFASLGEFASIGTFSECCFAWHFPRSRQSTPSECGLIRTRSIDNFISIRDRGVSMRLAINMRHLSSCWTSYGDTSGPFENILSRIMGEDSFKSFRAVLNPRTIQSLLKRKSLSDANSFRFFFKSALDAVTMASENVLQQYYATS